MKRLAIKDFRLSPARGDILLVGTDAAFDLLDIASIYRSDDNTGGPAVAYTCGARTRVPKSFLSLMESDEDAIKAVRFVARGMANARIAAARLERKP